MHTGYDNYWMYQNIRHDPVLSLPKNDNYSHAVLNHSNKPLPNGGNPSYSNSYLTSQKSIASSHQNNQSRMTNSQCVWPSSVYSLTLKSSYANNFQSPESYYNQSTNLNYSSQNSQTQQNYYSKHLRNTNVNFPQAFTNVNKNNNCSNSVQTQNSKNNDTQISRIRVKDVYSLNNSTFQNSFFENNLPQTYPKEQTECGSNYPTMNHFTSYNSKTMTEYANYEKTNFLESNHPCPPYGFTTTEQTKPCNGQKFFQNPDLFYQPNNQLSVESQFSNNKETEKNFPSKTYNNSINRELYDPKKIWEAKFQKCQSNSCDVLCKSKRVKVVPEKNSSERSNLQNTERACSYIITDKINNHYTNSFEANEKITHEMSNINKNAQNQSHYQNSISEIYKESPLRQVSFTGELNKCSKSGQHVPSSPAYSYNQIRGADNNLVKITIPHTGQSTFVQINDCKSVEKNSDLSLPSLLRAKNQSVYNTVNGKNPDYNNRKVENNGVISLSLGQVSQDYLVNSKIAPSDTNPVCNNSGMIQNHCNAEPGKFELSSPSVALSTPKILESSNEGLNLKEHVVGLKNQENYVFHNSDGLSKNILDNANSKISTEEKSQTTETVPSNDAVSKAVVIKQENCHSDLLVVNQSEKFIPENVITPQIIKIEKNVEDFSLHEHAPKSSISEKFRKETHVFAVDGAKNIDFSRTNGESVFCPEKPEPESRIIPNPVKNAENERSDASVDNSGKENTNFLTENKKEDEERKEEKEKVHESKESYKSKINREKLNLLIQFLNKEEGTVETSLSEETRPTDCLKKNYSIDQQEKEIHFNRNRRKLSKTSIVKNKNNSREMISLISSKVARADVFKCLSETPQIGQTVKDMDESEERSEKDSSVKDRSVDFSEKCHKINNSSVEDHTREEDCLISESKMNIFSGEKKENNSGKFSSEKENIILEEDNISSTMRTFQNLKTHFCMSCDLISSADSFWINVVSGELRCLNCFKKMMVRTEEQILKTKSEESGDIINSEANLIKKNEANLASENVSENTHKLEFANKSGNCKESESDDQKSNDFRENIKQELKEIINETSKEKITNKSNGPESSMSECCTVNAINFSNALKRLSVSLEDRILLLEKTVEQNRLAEKTLNKSLKSTKWKEDAAYKSKVSDVSKQEITELPGESKKKDTTDCYETSVEIKETKTPPIKSKEMNVLKENCSAFSLNQSNKDRKHVLKERGLSPKAKIPKNYKEENSSDRSVSKSDFTESCVTNKTHILKEDTKPELTDKSSRKSTFKEESILGEFVKEGKRKITGTLNPNTKKINAKEKITCQKLKISEERSERSKREITTDSLYESFCKKKCACLKMHSLEGTAKRNTKLEPLDKLRVQNALKEMCSDQKSKISEQKKIKKTDMDEKSKQKSVTSQNLTEIHRRGEWIDQSRKRKNAEDGVFNHKVRVVEEHAKKEIKPVTHLSDSSKEVSGNRKNTASEHEKQNPKDSGEKLGKNSSSKEESISFENPIKKETNHPSSEKSKTKDDLSCQKLETSEYSKHKKSNTSETPRRKSRDEHISSKPVVAKEHSKNETKKSKESPENSRRNSYPKKNSGSVSNHFKIGSSLPENKDSKTTEKKEKRHFSEKIPKKSHTVSDKNTCELLNHESKAISNSKIKKEQYLKTNKECPNRKSKNERKSSNKGKEETEIISNKKENKGFPSDVALDVETKEKSENDSNERRHQKSQIQNSGEWNLKEKVVACPLEEGIPAEELLDKLDGSKKTMLLTELIKKTKNLSWTLLNVAP